MNPARTSLPSPRAEAGAVHEAAQKRARTAPAIPSEEDDFLIPKVGASFAAVLENARPR